MHAGQLVVLVLKVMSANETCGTNRKGARRPQQVPGLSEPAPAVRLAATRLHAAAVLPDTVWLAGQQGSQILTAKLVMYQITGCADCGHLLGCWKVVV